MPLETQVKRQNRNVKFKHGWDYTLLSCFLTAAIQEQNPTWEYQEGKQIRDLKPGQYVSFDMAPIYYMDMPIDLWRESSQTLLKDHSFPVYTDGTSIEFKKGDILKMWRS